ncbi:MAG: DUF5060 domain-containing protein [Nibricoccus sp.]
MAESRSLVHRNCRRSLFWPLRIAAFLYFAVALNARPVEFEFKVSPSEANPFAREIWAEVTLPSGRVINHPAFYVGNNRYAVRARADSAGQYELGKITETRGESSVELVSDVRGSRQKDIRAAELRPGIKIDPVDPRRFVLSSGERFVPLGANLAWPDASGLRFYRRAFEAFSRNGLNWTRVWMSHWGGLNLDWPSERRGPSPRGVELDLRVAEKWDEIFETAEKKGVYFQMVLQHHGQYSTEVNSNWKDNPWNVANGGFLNTPVEFFTSPEAIQLTMQKYRYIVARWGYSPALMCWELFNEVHWTDAMRGENKNEEAVARWHSLMAGYLRSIDRYGHLVTTSTEDFNSPVYADMDYFQPHLYAPNLLAGARKFVPEPGRLTKPAFYGEMGDDHLQVSDEVKKSGVTIVPPVWSGLMGQGYFPAQVWLGSELIKKERLAELGAVARFLQASGLYRCAGLTPCEMVVECEERVPLVLAGGHMWHRLPPPEMNLPLDGREPLGLPDIPRIYMNREETTKNGFPNRATYHVNLPKPLTLRFRIADSAQRASGFRFSIDGVVAAEMTWPEPPKDTPPKNGPRPQPDIVAAVPAGEHTLVVENPADTGWFDLAEIDFDLEQSVLAAVGQRNDRFVALWLWNRRGVFAGKTARAVSGIVLVDDLPAGQWRVTWWDTLTGKPDVNQAISHNGGILRLCTPKIAHHAAVLIERSD